MKPTPIRHEPVRTPSTRWVLATLSLSMLLSSLGTSIANVGLSALMVAFDASFQAVQWVVLAYLLAITTLIVGVGRLGDGLGRRRLLLAGIALFTLSSALCGLSPTLGLLIAARAAQGLGAAVMMALTLAFVGETIPRARTGSAMGLLGAMSSIGTTLGPSLGGVLIAGPGWRAIFLISVPLGILTLGMACRSLPAGITAAGKGGRGLDWVGTVLLGLTLAAYTLAMTLGRGNFGRLNIGLLIAAGLGTVLFVIAETKIETPLVRLAMFRDLDLSASLVMSLIVTTVLMATLVVGPFYLAGALGLHAWMAGVVLSAGPLVAALAALPAGRLADRFGAHRMMLGGLVVIAAGTLMLSFVAVWSGIIGYTAPIALISVGYAVFQTSNNAAVMAGVRADQRGVISGLLNLSRNLGLITGASVLGAVFAAASGAMAMQIQRPEAVASGMRITFAVATVMMVLAIMVTVTAHRRTSRNRIFRRNDRPAGGAVAGIVSGPGHLYSMLPGGFTCLRRKSE